MVITVYATTARETSRTHTFGDVYLHTKRHVRIYEVCTICTLSNIYTRYALYVTISLRGRVGGWYPHAGLIHAMSVRGIYREEPLEEWQTHLYRMRNRKGGNGKP